MLLRFSETYTHNIQVSQVSYFIKYTSACMPVHANKTNKQKLSNRVPETTTTLAVPSLSRAVRAWPHVQNKKKKKLSNNHTGRSFAVVNDDWIGALCLRKSRKYRNGERKNTESR